MKFSYIKLSDKQYKLIVQNDGGYGEFYLNFENDGVVGTGEVKCKDKEYGAYLVKQLESELGSMPVPDDDHDCKLDEWGTGHCDHPSHGLELIDDERAETESEAYRLAHS